MKHIFLGRGVFTSANTIEVAGKTLKFDKVRRRTVSQCALFGLKVTVYHNVGETLKKRIKIRCDTVTSSFIIGPTRLCRIATMPAFLRYDEASEAANIRFAATSLR